MKRVVVVGLAALIAVIGVGGAGNVFAYDRKAGALEQKWREEQAAGVPRDQLDRLRAQLRQIESQRGGAVPYALTSFALVRNPLGPLEQQTQAIYDRVNAQSRAQAETALKGLLQAYGPTPFDVARQRAQVGRAHTPSDYQRLARAWTAEAAKVNQAKAQLAAKSGGMNGDLPADVVTARDQITQAAAKLTQAQMWTEPSAQALDTAKQYLAGSYQSMLAQHDTVAAQLNAVNAAVSHRLDLRTQADDLVTSLPDLLKYSQDGDYAARADQAKQAVAAAGTDQALESSVGSLQGVVDELWDKKQDALRKLAAGSSTCIAGLQGKYIFLSLSAQALIACQDGTPFLRTLVTTGRPGMETPTGSFAISAKYAELPMKSLCEPGTDCWYPTATVYNAMRFYGQYYYLHSWPQAAYGPGTQYDLSVASHGCVHIPGDPITQLYNWAPVGTPVIVTG
jgi:lipoprotein-anchoring transpeptidase ErfK/SrfK